jgi:hypothetical protein
MNVPNPTKFFLSSSAQDSLTAIRNTAFEQIRELGHAPEMYERTFGPWPSETTAAQHCIDKVRECDVFCLFLHNKAGSMMETGRTVTHLEFIQAVNEKKVLLLFADQTIKRQFFHSIKWIIERFIGEYRTEHGRNPSYITISEYLEERSREDNSDVPVKQTVEPYVWVFLYDIIVVHGKYVDDLNMGVAITWKEYLSDLLRQGVELIPKRSVTKESMELAEAFESFSQLAIDLMKYVSISGLNLRRVLVLARENLAGATIVEDFKLTKSKIGDVNRCTAICLFKRENDTLKIIHSEGDTDGDKDFKLNDESSFVATTYNNYSDEEPVLSYIESKGMFYLTSKVREYVISYHFPEETEWSQMMFEEYNEFIIDGIINSHANALVLGGLQK